MQMPEEHPNLIGGAQRDRGERYLTLAEMRRKLGGRSRSAIYADLAAGRLPRPVKLGAINYWPETLVDEHLRKLRAEAD